MRDLIKALLRHNHEVTGLPVPRDIPLVKWTSYTWLSRMTGARCVDGMHIAAAYVDNGKCTIWLHHAWSENDPIDRALLAHELVHHMQNRADKWDERIELDAYRSQFAYLRMHGIDPVQLGYSENYNG